LGAGIDQSERARGAEAGDPRAQFEYSLSLLSGEKAAADRPHHDYLDPNASGFAEQLRRFGQRIATVLVYLNDNYTGGQTVFPKIGLRYRGKTGDALFFTNVDRTGRADPLTMHAGTPPTSGEKWVISQWVRDRAPTSPLAAGASGG